MTETGFNPNIPLHLAGKEAPDEKTPEKPGSEAAGTAERTVENASAEHKRLVRRLIDYPADQLLEDLLNLRAGSVLKALLDDPSWTSLSVLDLEKILNTAPELSRVAWLLAAGLTWPDERHLLTVSPAKLKQYIEELDTLAQSLRTEALEKAVPDLLTVLSERVCRHMDERADTAAARGERVPFVLDRQFRLLEDIKECRLPLYPLMHYLLSGDHHSRGWMMANPPHPGGILKSLFDEGQTVEAVAHLMRVSPDTLRKIIDGKAPVTKDFACKLPRAFPVVKPGLFPALQMEYDYRQRPVAGRKMKEIRYDD